MVRKVLVKVVRSSSIHCIMVAFSLLNVHEQSSATSDNYKSRDVEE
jgi:hypothetical protein